jgi:hypothetical protein
MDTENQKMIFFQSRLNEPRKARKAEEIFTWDFEKKVEKKTYI